MGARVHVGLRAASVLFIVPSSLQIPWLYFEWVHSENTQKSSVGQALCSVDGNGLCPSGAICWQMTRVQVRKYPPPPRKSSVPPNQNPVFKHSWWVGLTLCGDGGWKEHRPVRECLASLGAWQWAGAEEELQISRKGLGQRLIGQRQMRKSLWGQTNPTKSDSSPG